MGFVLYAANLTLQRSYEKLAYVFFLIDLLFRRFPKECHAMYRVKSSKKPCKIFNTVSITALNAVINIVLKKLQLTPLKYDCKN